MRSQIYGQCFPLHNTTQMCSVTLIDIVYLHAPYMTMLLLCLILLNALLDLVQCLLILRLQIVLVIQHTSLVHKLLKRHHRHSMLSRTCDYLVVHPLQLHSKSLFPIVVLFSGTMARFFCEMTIRMLTMFCYGVNPVISMFFSSCLVADSFTGYRFHFPK